MAGKSDGIYLAKADYICIYGKWLDCLKEIIHSCILLCAKAICDRFSNHPIRLQEVHKCIRILKILYCMKIIDTQIPYEKLGKLRLFYNAR